MVDLLYRNVSVGVRGINREAREATFCASTENPVETRYGREVLKQRGAVLDRYRANPVLLNAHDGSTIANVLGSAQRVSVVKASTRAADGRERDELETVFRFADTPEGERAWKLVEGGHVRAVSVGYRVDPLSIRRVMEGETFEGVTGPAVVVNRWELLEVSLVPVPADKDATVRRSIFEERPMSQPATTETPAVVEDFGAAPAIREMGTKQPASVFARAAQAAAAETPAPALAPSAVPTITATVDGQSVTRPLPAVEEAARASAIRALAPKGLETLADQLVLEGKSVVEARAALLAAHTKRSAPVGTPETPAAPAPAAPLANVTDDTLLRSFKRNF